MRYTCCCFGGFFNFRKTEIELTKPVYKFLKKFALASYTTSCTMFLIWYWIIFLMDGDEAMLWWSDWCWSLDDKVKYKRSVVLYAVFLCRCCCCCCCVSIKATCCPGQRGANHSGLYRPLTEGGFHLELEPLAQETTGYLYFQALPPLSLDPKSCSSAFMPGTAARLLYKSSS